MKRYISCLVRLAHVKNLTPDPTKKRASAESSSNSAHRIRKVFGQVPLRKIRFEMELISHVQHELKRL